MSQKEKQPKQTAADQLSNLRSTWGSSSIFLPNGIKKQMAMLQKEISGGKNDSIRADGNKVLK